MPALNVRFDEKTLGLIKLAALGRKVSLAKWVADACGAAVLRQAAGGGEAGAALAAELDRRAAIVTATPPRSGTSRRTRPSPGRSSTRSSGGTP